MENFYDKVQDTQDNVSITENGMAGYKTTKHALLDFNFKVASYRSDLNKGVEDFKEVLKEKDTYILKYLMYLRDVREGIGERDLFRVCLKEFINSNFEDKDNIIDTIIKTTPEYGRFDDLFVLFNTSYEDKVVDFIKNQLKEDLLAGPNKKPISLLAKWLPSENASSKETRARARHLMQKLNLEPKAYRQILSTLRSKLNVVEVKTCANEWDEIDYNIVPSKANLKYTNAFLKHDEARRREFLSKAFVGDKSVNVNMSVAFPHEIVHQYSKHGFFAAEFDQSLEAYWKNLKPCVGLEDTIVVRDGSGSMCSRVGNTSISALDISTALAIYCSQFLKEGFKDKFITFSAKAKLIDLSKCGSLQSKLEKTFDHDECENTNIESVFELILNTAIENNMKQEDIPSNVLIISDMEFDPAEGVKNHYFSGMNAGSNVFKTMDAKFKAHGYKLPRLAFWNVNSRTTTIPCRFNENGVLLISGFSQNVLSMVMNGKTDPYEALVEELNKERYESIPLVTFSTMTKTKKEKVDISTFLE